MPCTATGAAAGAQCLACDTLDANRKHTCKEAEGQRGIIPKKAWPGGKPPSKTKYLKDARDAQKKQATARKKAGAKPYEEGTTVKLPSRVTPSSEDDIKDFIFPERRGGPVLAQADRQLLAKIVARSYWAGGFPCNMGGAEIVAALLAAKVVVEPWNCDWFQGFVDSEADAKKRNAKGRAKGNATKKRESYDKYDADDLEDDSDTHGATYKRLARQLACKVADRDNKERPTWKTIWKDPHYSVWNQIPGAPRRRRDWLISTQVLLARHREPHRRLLRRLPAVVRRSVPRYALVHRHRAPEGRPERGRAVRRPVLLPVQHGEPRARGRRGGGAPRTGRDVHAARRRHARAGPPRAHGPRLGRRGGAAPRAGARGDRDALGRRRGARPRASVDAGARPRRRRRALRRQRVRGRARHDHEVVPGLLGQDPGRLQEVQGVRRALHEEASVLE